MGIGRWNDKILIFDGGMGSLLQGARAETGRTAGNLEYQASGGSGKDP